MKGKFIILFCIASSYLFPCLAQSRQDTLTIATYNLRIRTKTDTGVREWENRRNHIASLIKNHQFDIFGAQEIVDKKQEKSLAKQLPEYEYVSYGRNDQKGTKGERLAIFYDKEILLLEQQGFFFLSETPDLVSKGWDAKYNRICMYVKLRPKDMEESFYVFNTHFDHIGTIARQESAKLICKKIDELAGDSVQVILTGDFNSPPSDTIFYNILSTQFYDSKNVENATEEYYSSGTFNDWQGNETYFPETQRIDFIFIKNANVIQYEVLHDKFIDEIYPSDHFPVAIKIVQ
ncbi:endonuclease [Bacteroidia bacterium]|nr:endonuclease [Bacteroidia bacterium]